MPQHDYDIANAPGATVRADINNALDAIVALNSGATAPSTTFAYQLWADTGNGVLKQRNSGNTSWIIVGSLDVARVVNRTTAYTADLSDFGKTILCDASSSGFTVTLPAVADAGDNFELTIKIDDGDTSGNQLTIDGDGSEVIDGSTTKVLERGGQSVRLRCDGSEWRIVSFYDPNIDDKLNLRSSELTTSSGSVTPVLSHHTIDTESDAATDDLDTLATSSVAVGHIVILKAENTSRVVTVKHNTGNLSLINGEDFELETAQSSICLELRGSTWYELWRTPLNILTISDIIHLQHQQNSGVNGDTLSSTSWNVLTLNTEVTNNISGASLSSGSQIVLPAGTYRVWGAVIFSDGGGCRLAIYNADDTSYILQGPGMLQQAGDNHTEYYTIFGEFILSAQKNIEMRLYVRNGDTQNSLGTGQDEVYTDLVFEKVA